MDSGCNTSLVIQRSWVRFPAGYRLFSTNDAKEQVFFAVSYHDIILSMCLKERNKTENVAVKGPLKKILQSHNLKDAFLE